MQTGERGALRALTDDEFDEAEHELAQARAEAGPVLITMLGLCINPATPPGDFVQAWQTGRLTVGRLYEAAAAVQFLRSKH